MKNNPLGRSGINVSQLCLGTMTFGVQTSQEDAFKQMDMAIEAGINCFDTAELYPVLPISRETQGESERIIGEWTKARGKRDDVILMSKIVGINNSTAKNGEPINRDELNKSIERSLKNLQTDCIDLYQLHWPNRGHYHFRRLWNYEVGAISTAEIEDNFLETLKTLDDLKKAGKIRAWGASNETAWGIMKFIDLAERHNLPRIASTQNEYSLLHRIYEPDLHEVSIREDVGLLTYSSLAGGLLTGKYDGGKTIPAGSRRSIEENVGGRVNPWLWPIIDEYLAIAAKHNIEPVHFAYRFCLSQPFVASVIIGASNADQLAHILNDDYMPLPIEALEDIAALRRKYPIPM